MRAHAGRMIARVVAIATTITGDTVCRATNVSIRLDTPDARSFLATQVSYPLP
jgi:hypothetical protein